MKITALSTDYSVELTEEQAKSLQAYQLKRMQEGKSNLQDQLERKGAQNVFTFGIFVYFSLEATENSQRFTAIMLKIASYLAEAQKETV